MEPRMANLMGDGEAAMFQSVDSICAQKYCLSRLIAITLDVLGRIERIRGNGHFLQPPTYVANNRIGVDRKKLIDVRFSTAGESHIPKLFEKSASVLLDGL